MLIVEANSITVSKVHQAGCDTGVVSMSAIIFEYQPISNGCFHLLPYWEKNSSDGWFKLYVEMSKMSSCQKDVKWSNIWTIEEVHKKKKSTQ